MIKILEYQNNLTQMYGWELSYFTNTAFII